MVNSLEIHGEQICLIYVVLKLIGQFRGLSEIPAPIGLHGIYYGKLVTAPPLEMQLLLLIITAVL